MSIVAGSIVVSEALNVTEPVDVEAVKRFAQRDDSEWDLLIADMIPAAREDVENFTHLVFVPKTISFRMEDCYSALLPYAEGEITITGVTDEDAEETLTPTEYKVKAGTLVIDYKGNYEVTYSIVPKVSASIKEAIKMLITYRLDNRGDQKEQHGIPADIKAKLNPKIITWL